uniref:Peptidase_M13 domain-containing protein n=1 Tax=Steinernema glaseri TaxID=37863 RepID=A0A1I7ZEX6_9BILA
MADLLSKVSVAILILTLGVAIASLVLNIVILGKENSHHDSDNKPAASPAPTTTPLPTLVPTPPPVIRNTTKYQKAADTLYSGMDESVDPCDDFYGFTCGSYIKNAKIPDGAGRIGTYDLSQQIVNQRIFDALATVTDMSTATEQITKKVINACIANAMLKTPEDKSKTVYDLITKLFGGLPLLNSAWTTVTPAAFWKGVGILEGVHNVPSLLQAQVTVDQRDVSRNALYINQGGLMMPRDFYVKPQFLANVEDYLSSVQSTFSSFAKHLNLAAPAIEDLQELVQFEIELATAMAQVTVDQRDVSRNALYINQGGLMMPRDFYVKPQFLANVEDYLSSVQSTFSSFAKHLNLAAPAIEDLQELVQFEIELATAMVPDDLLRNYRQQYNGYSVVDLANAYQFVSWNDYFTGMGLPNATKDELVVAQPTYLAALSSIFGGKGGVYDGQRFSMKTAVNFVVLRLLQDASGFLGGQQHAEFVSFLSDNGVKKPVAAANETIVNCVDEAAGLMVYGPGYVYIQSIPEREQVRKNVTTQTTLIIDAFFDMMGTLTWMTDASKAAAKNKRDGLVKNIGWPAMFDKTDGSLDKYNSLYKPILQANVTDYWDILLILKSAYQQTENIGTVFKQADRANFLSSPSTVNAWYQPERNSITFPYAAFNPPYFDFDYPQAYNFAGQGGTGGHELTHGYDDEGVQFGRNGTLGGCSWDYCGWMDSKSRAGFQNMAQCVISQYSSTCCPKELKDSAVHCANGATTQGENIADLGGQQAAYHAYQNWKQRYNGGVEEPRLPGKMSKYTPNQVFWITYGYSWCMKQSPKNLVNQLLTNPHAPGSCRTNQVVQDIPEFGHDFNCPRGSKMYPKPEENVRCKVWTGV